MNRLNASDGGGEPAPTVVVVVDGGIPAQPAIQATAASRQADGHLYADTVLAELAGPTGFRTLVDLLPSTSAPAVRSIDPAVPPCTHAELRRFIADEFDLAQFGLGRNDRVALLMPNGPELAVAFVAVLSYCTCAPLNPASTLAEIAVDLRATGTKCVIAMAPDPGLASVVADTGAMLVIAEPAQGPAGLFTMSAAPGQTARALTDGSTAAARVAAREPAEREDIAFVLQTSGTTGNKKLVPHTLEDLVAGAVCIAAACQLGPADVCCNQMPLFHIGGIARNVLAPVISGGSVIAMPFFLPSLFWQSASDAAATWYYAGPTMHMLILEAYKALAEPPALQLRFVANAAGPLLHTVAEQMRDVFTAASGRRVSIMPSYGMTECMPISSPPVGYNLERPGCSGQIVGPRVQVQDMDGNELPIGEVGQIMLRGRPVMRGYENNPAANAESFVNGWFRTGDMGYLDGEAAGYLFITGRSKDVINRGGELISPIEVEEALQSHPLIKELVAFPTRHDLLQETVGVFIVMQPNCPRLSLGSLQAYAARVLHPSKWPQVAVYSNSLPKTSTGKAMRTKLDARLRLPEISDATPPLGRHFEAGTVPVGTPVSEPIACAPVTVDVQRLIHALKRPGRDVHVVRSEGRLTAYVTPRSADQGAIAAELSYLPQYLVPLTIPLAHIPRDAEGNVVEERLISSLADKPKELGGGSTVIEMAVSKVKALLKEVTGANVHSDDELSACGVDSLRMAKLLAMLKAAFPEATIRQLFLLSNPTVQELAVHVAGADGGDGDTDLWSNTDGGDGDTDLSSNMSSPRESPKLMDMSAVFGLRVVICLWIVRAHLLVGCDYSLPGTSQLSNDVIYSDLDHKWRVTIFILLAAMMMAMKYDRTRASAGQRLKEFVPPLLPMVWLTLAVHIPLGMVVRAGYRITRPESDAFLYESDAGQTLLVVASNLMWGTLTSGLFSPLFGNQNLTGAKYQWYLGAQVLFVAVFSTMQDFSKQSLDKLFRRGGVFASCRRLYRSEPPKYRHTTELRPFLRRVCLTSLVAVLIIGIPRAVVGPILGYHPSKGPSSRDAFEGPWPTTVVFHFNGICRLPQFYLGIVLGQGCLHVKLTDRQRRRVGIAVDAVVLLVIALVLLPVPIVGNDRGEEGSLSPAGGSLRPLSVYVLELLHVPIMTFVLFGLCRAPGSSYAHRLLSSKALQALTPSTYCIYMVHIPILRWVTHVRRFGVTNIFSGSWDLEWHDAWYARAVELPYNSTTRAVLGEKTPGLCGFDYTLSGFDNTTLPPKPPACGLGGFEWLGVFVFSVAAGVLMNYIVHEPFTRWYNRFLMNRAARRRKQERGRTPTAKVAPQVASV